MNILFVTFYFPPEIGAPQRRIWETAQHLIKRGHRVQVLTGFPNYPRGEIIAPYRRQLFLRENLEGIEVLRVFHLFGGRKGKWGRAVAEGSFFFATALAALLERAPDVVIVESPSLLSCLTGVLLKRMRNSAFVMHPSDLIPEVALALGMLSPGFLSELLTKMENFFYRQTDGIIAVTEGVRGSIMQKGFPSDKIWLIPNGVDDGYFEKRLTSPPNGKFRAVYAGSHGRAYNLRSVLAAARELPAEGFEFEFIGDGIDRAELQKEAQLMPQVRFLGGLPVEKMFERLYTAQAMVIPLADREALAATIPSKMADGWAAGLPVILAARKGELVELVRENRAGIVVEPENPQALAEAFRYLREHPEEARQMGERGREFVRQTRMRSILVDQLEKMLLELVERKRKAS